MVQQSVDDYFGVKQSKRKADEKSVSEKKTKDKYS